MGAATPLLRACGAYVGDPGLFQPNSVPPGHCLAIVGPIPPAIVGPIPPAIVGRYIVAISGPITNGYRAPITNGYRPLSGTYY